MTNAKPNRVIHGCIEHLLLDRLTCKTYCAELPKPVGNYFSTEQGSVNIDKPFLFLLGLKNPEVVWLECVYDTVILQNVKALTVSRECFASIYMHVLELESKTFTTYGSCFNILQKTLKLL